MKDKAYLFSTRGSIELGKKISHSYNQNLGLYKVLEFSDGEFMPTFEQTIRGSRVFLIGSTNQPNDNLMELLLMCDAAKRASASKITVVIPYFGFARQDRKHAPRVPIGAKLVSKMLMVAGATRIMTMDLHADQIQGFFEIPVDHIFASTIFIDYLKNISLNNLCIASPDMGGAKRANTYANNLCADIVVCHKERKEANKINNITLIGDVLNKNVVLVDDIIDTGSTLCRAAQVIMDKGAASVRAIATHGIFSKNALDIIYNSPIKEIVITDSIPVKKSNSKLKILSCASLFANVMHSVHHNKSISSLFDK